MGKRLFLLSLSLLLLTACAGTREAEFTPLPYQQDESIWIAVGKTFVNLPVWTVETAAAAGFLAAWLWLEAGAPGITR